jgi:hypothetical protein
MLPAEPGFAVPEPEEVILVARGIATAIAPDEGVQPVQAAILRAITGALTGVDVDYCALEPLGPEALAAGLTERDAVYKQRIVHHMVLGELVLRPLPIRVAHRVATYARALDVEDDFVRVARRYAQGAYGLAWMDLQRSGFVDHVRATSDVSPKPAAGPARPFEPAHLDPGLEARWREFERLPAGSLGHRVWELYDSRGFALPGSPGGAPEYLAQHDFVHVLADYGTNLRGELEVFAFIGRADPDPKGFAWLATLIGLFETGFIADTGFFERDVRERNLQHSGMDVRVAEAIRRGKVTSERCGTDLFDVDYHALAGRSVEEVREVLKIPEKSATACELGSAGAFDRDGMSEIQQRYADQRESAQQ